MTACGILLPWRGRQRWAISARWASRYLGKQVGVLVARPGRPLNQWWEINSHSASSTEKLRAQMRLGTTLSAAMFADILNRGVPNGERPNINSGIASVEYKTLRQTIATAATAVASSFLIASAVSAEAPKPVVTKLKAESPTHLLFVGNSYLYYGDSLHNHVRRMVIAAGTNPAHKLKYKSATISGSALHDHNIESYLQPGKLRVKGPFQVVVMQGGSAVGWSKKRPPVFKEAVAEFARKIRASGGEPALYMTHAYVKPHKRVDPAMTERLATIYTETGNAAGALVIPVGLAFAEAYSRKPTIKLHKAFDGSHPSLLGTILAANTVYAAIYGSPVGNPYDYYGKISKQDLAFIQRVAQDTVTKFYGR
jgi:hypothetical protein